MWSKIKYLTNIKNVVKKQNIVKNPKLKTWLKSNCIPYFLILVFSGSKYDLQDFPAEDKIDVPNKNNISSPMPFICCN